MSGRATGGAALLVAAMAAAGGPVAAQVSSVSARAQAMGSSYTALARGYSAIRWNPAGLALSGSPGFSLAIAPVRAATGVGPIGTAELADWDDRLVPHEVRLDWLETIREAGGERGTVRATATGLALSVGRLGIQYGVVVDGRVNVAPDAAELILFGNAGLTGEPRPFEFSGSTVQATVTSTLAVSYAQPLPIDLGVFPGERLAFGITVKRTMGHAVVYGRDVGSRATADPVELHIDFPVVHTDTSDGFPEYGAGWGLDLGLAWEGGPWSVGAVVRNAVHTFEWDLDDLVFTPATAAFSPDTATSGFDERPIGEAPAELVEGVESLTYHPEVALGLAWSSAQASVSADIRHRFDDGIQTTPRSHVGVGAELRPIPLLPVRVGAAWVTDGYLLTGGVGLETGVVNIGLTLGTRHSGIEDAVIVAVALSFGGS